MPTWRIHLLGGLEVFRDGRVLPRFPTRKAKWLFAYLVLHRNRIWSRDAIAQILWEDLPEASARKRLRNEIWRIRHVLYPEGENGECCLRTDGGSIRFEPPPEVWIDIAQIEAALEGNGEPADVRVRIGQLCEAADLYRGELLEECEEEWCYGPRERLRQGYLSILEQLVDHHRACHNWQAAIVYARRILRSDPLLEHIQRKMMLCYWHQGDRASALRQYSEFANLLRRELAVEPMAETQEAYQWIRGSQTREAHAMEARRHGGPEVGRILSQLDHLQRNLEETVRSLRRAILDLESPRR